MKDFSHHIRVVRNRNAAIRQTRVQQLLMARRQKSAEQVARAKVHPHRRLARGGANGCAVIFGNLEARFPPYSALGQ